jgi:methenyltetrahydrofolate cyclohydrolase
MRIIFVGDSDQVPIQLQTINDFHLQVADHDVFCGGGSVAAVTASSAASLLLLVMGLSARRRSNAPMRDRIEASITRTQAIQQGLLYDADADMEALQFLMEAQKSLKKGQNKSDYRQALVAAASVPLSIARQSIELLEITEEMLSSASRFTVSDLGAAAGLALGSIRASTLMSEVNLALLKTDSDADQDLQSTMLRESQLVLELGESIASRIDATVRSTVRQE